jgi:imidazolonepropionase-like amidohydrolase
VFRSLIRANALGLPLLSVVLLIFFGTTATAGADEKSVQVYIHAGHLLADPSTGQVDSNKTIVVTDGRVSEIRDGYVSGPHVIDLSDKFVLPGLIDSHVHLNAELHEGAEFDRLRKTQADETIDAVMFAGRTVRAGFTTVADLGGDGDAIFALRDGTAAGKVVGPRVIAAGFVGAHGGHGAIQGFIPQILRAFDYSGLCSGADDCRRAVRMAVQRGADMIKTASTGGVLSDTDSGLGQQMTDEELLAITQTAHMLGRRVACHAHGADGIAAAVRAGVDSIEHGTYLDADSIKMMKAKGIYLVPTLLAGDTVVTGSTDDHWMTPKMRAKAKNIGPAMIDATRRAHLAGVKIAFGTDSAVSKHGQNAREFSLLIKAGFTPIDAIRAATVWGAAHNNLSSEVGSIAPGKAADIIAVTGSPLTDITRLEHVEFVMHDGRIFKRPGYSSGDDQQ